MKLAVLAWRNLHRHWRRSLMSLLVIAAGTIALVFTAGFVRFSFEGLREAIIHGGLGHLEIAAESPSGASMAGMDGSDWRFRDWHRVRDKVEKLEGVVAASATLRLTGLASSGERSVAFLAAAVEPDRERLMGFVTRVREGSALPDSPPEEGEDLILLAEGLARSLHLGLGDIATLLAMTEEGTLNAIDTKVIGIITTGVQEFDDRFAKIHLGTAQRLLATESVTALVIGLESTLHTSSVQKQIASLLHGEQPALTVADWRSRAPFYGQVEMLYLSIFGFLGTIVFVLACLATSSTLYLSVMERFREFGTLRALGTSKLQVALMVWFEAAWLGLCGAACGNVLGLLLAAGLNSLHFQMPPPPGGTGGIDLQLAIRPIDLLGTILVMLVVASLAAILPAVNAARMRIVKALAHA